MKPHWQAELEDRARDFTRRQFTRTPGVTLIDRKCAKCRRCSMALATSRCVTCGGTGYLYVQEPVPVATTESRMRAVYAVPYKPRPVEQGSQRWIGAAAGLVLGVVATLCAVGGEW